MTEQVEPTPGDTPASESLRLVEAGVALLACRSEDDVYRVMADFLAVAVPDAIVLVNRCTDDPYHVVVQSVSGIDAPLLGKVTSALGATVAGMRARVKAEDVGRTYVRSLQLFEGGIAAYAAGYAPAPVLESVARMLGLRDVYIIGIADGASVFGNITVITRGSDAKPPRYVIETLVHLGFMSLARLEATGDLAASEERFRAVFEAAADGIFMMSVDGHLRLANPAMAQMHGYTTEEMAGLDLASIDTAETAVLAPERMNRLLTGEPLSFEVEHRRKDGSTLPLEVAASVATVGGERLVLGFHRDITERREGDRALRESERWLSASQRVAHLGHYVYDIVRDHWVGSQALHDEVFGTLDRVGSDFHGWLDIVHPEDRGRLADYFQTEVIGKRRPFDIEYRIVRPADGVERWVHGLGTVEYDDQDTPTRMFGVIQDITDRRRSEDALRASETRLRAAQAISRVGSWVWHLGSNRLEWSDEMYRIFGIEKEGFSGDLSDVVASAIHPDDREAVEAVNRSVAEDGVPVPMEYRVVHPDGTELVVWAEAGNMVLDAEGNPDRLEGVVVDLTERKAADAEIRRLNTELEQRVRERTEALHRSNTELQQVNAELEATNAELLEATRAKSDFLAAMSHELRTPLNSIIGFSGVLGQGLTGPLNAEQSGQVAMINRSGRHLLSLIDGVLDLAKIESGKTQTSMEEIDVGAVASDVVEAVRPLAEDKGLSIEFTCRGCEDGLRTDAGKLRQILFNLMGNAVKFTVAGSVRLQVSRAQGGWWEFAVSDTGAGIATDDLSRIFEPFTQLDTPGYVKPKGTGLGLRISQDYAHLLGGGITVTSEPGGGSTFLLRVPAEPPEPA